MWRWKKSLLGLLCLAFSLQAAQGAGADERIDLGRLAARCGVAVSYGDCGNCGAISADGLEVKCRLNSACYCVNGTNVYGQCPVAGQPGRLCLAKSDWDRVIVPLLSPRQPQQLRRICIDPGHGGKDCGARRPRIGLEEKNLTLDVAKRLQKLLQKRGFDVVLTRSDDSFVPLETRSSMANRFRCDLFICIHFNAADSAKAEGAETYIVPLQGAASTARLQNLNSGDKKFCTNNRYDERNLCLAFCLQRQLHGIKSTNDRGVKRGRFKVLEEVNCPAALVECGFITGFQEGHRIATGEHRQAIAAALCEGICSYGAGSK